MNIAVTASPSLAGNLQSTIIPAQSIDAQQESFLDVIIQQHGELTHEHRRVTNILKNLNGVLDLIYDRPNPAWTDPLVVAAFNSWKESQ